MYASLGQAAKATGLSRSTILRAIKAHRISAAKTDTGDWAIDPAELHRVFPPAAQATQQDMTRQATAAEQAATALQITALHDLAELLRRQLDDLRDDRDHWRGMAEAGQRLLAPPRIGGPIIASEINAAPRTHHPPHVPQTSRPAHGTRVSVRFRQPPRAFTPRAGRLARYCPQEP